MQSADWCVQGERVEGREERGGGVVEGGLIVSARSRFASEDEWLSMAPFDAETSSPVLRGKLIFRV